MIKFPVLRKLYEPVSVESDGGDLVERFFLKPFFFDFNFQGITPLVDIYEKDNKVVVKIEIPGSKAEEIKLSAEDNLLIISGEKKEEHAVKKENYYRLESTSGKFQRAVELPVQVSAEQATATYNDGILKVELPKAHTQQRKEIKIDIK